MPLPTRVKIWDTASGQEVAVLESDTGNLRVYFSPDGGRLIGLGGKPGELHVVVWDGRPLP